MGVGPVSWPSMPNPAYLDPTTAGSPICPIPIPAALVSALSWDVGQYLQRSAAVCHRHVAQQGPGGKSSPRGYQCRLTGVAGVWVHPLESRWLPELLFVAHSARRRAGRRRGSARCCAWMRRSSRRAAAAASPASARPRCRAARCPPASTSGSRESGQR